MRLIMPTGTNIGNFCDEDFEITSKGRTGAEFGQDPENISVNALFLLTHKEFVTTEGKIYKVAFISDDDLEGKERTNANIRAAAQKKGYLEPPAELAPLIFSTIRLEKFDEMDISGIVVMHRPMKGPSSKPYHLGCWIWSRPLELGVFDSDPNYKYEDRFFNGLVFAFLKNQQ